MAYPIATVIRPAALAGHANGRLDDDILVTIEGIDGGPKLRLVKPAALAWIAMAAAALAAGIALKATSAADSYRIYAIQERIFRERYTTKVLPGRPSRVWNGVRWYQLPGTAAAAVPGTSNHGWALAVDVDLTDKRVLPWLVEHAERFGFSWELQSEAWHLRYVAGDRLPDAVAAHTGPVQSTPDRHLPRSIVHTFSGPDGVLHTVGVGPDHRVYKITGKPESGKVEDLGGAAISVSGAFEDSTVCTVTCVGVDGKLYVTRWTGAGWTPWDDHPSAVFLVEV